MDKQIEESLEYEWGPVAVKEYNEQGILQSFYSYEMSKDKDRRVSSLSRERFENAYVVVPNPFELNDRVRIVGKRKIGIVATSKEDWEKSVKKAWKDNAYEDFSDASIIIIYNEDSYDHNHVCPIYLEKVNTDEVLRTTR